MEKYHIEQAMEDHFVKKFPCPDSAQINMACHKCKHRGYCDDQIERENGFEAFCEGVKYVTTISEKIN